MFLILSINKKNQMFLSWININYFLFALQEWISQNPEMWYAMRIIEFTTSKSTRTGNLTRKLLRSFNGSWLYFYINTNSGYHWHLCTFSRRFTKTMFSLLKKGVYVITQWIAENSTIAIRVYLIFRINMQMQFVLKFLMI